jgi:hypothetical protein
MKENSLCERIDFIKADVEGAEYGVFRGAEKLLRSNPEILLLFECSAELCLRAGNKIDDVFNFLRSLDFKLFGWDKKHHKWQSNEEFLLAAGNIWACRDKKQLPHFNS